MGTQSLCVNNTIQSVCVCVYMCVHNNLCLITASVAVIILRYKHHQSPVEVTLFITALFIGLWKRLFIVQQHQVRSSMRGGGSMFNRCIKKII